MARTTSPKLKKSEADRLTGRQQASLKRATASVGSAKNAVADLKSKKSAQQEAVNTLRGHLQKLDEKLEAHPLAKRRAEKADEILVAKSDLRAQAQLEDEIPGRNGTIVALQDELNGADEEDENADGGD